MKNFDDGEDQGFFIPIDMPLYRTQCDLLEALLSKNLEPSIYDSIQFIGHDGYGSFKIYTEPGVDRTDELKESVLIAGDELFCNLSSLYDFSAFASDCTDTNDKVGYYCYLYRECGYSLPKPKELIEDLVGYGLSEKEVEQAVFLQLLKGEAA